MVRDVKITVVKTTFDKELADQYAVKDFGPCPQNYPGKVYLSKGGLKPEGLCDDAWIPMERFVFALAHGVDHFFDDWIDVDGTTVNCCNDGLRPVIFRCEAVETNRGDQKIPMSSVYTEPEEAQNHEMITDVEAEYHSLKD